MWQARRLGVRVVITAMCFGEAVLIDLLVNPVSIRFLYPCCGLRSFERFNSVETVTTTVYLASQRQRCLPTKNASGDARGEAQDSSPAELE